MPHERFDIFDEHMKRIGTATRQETRANGFWHQTFHCWIAARAEKGPALLFQKRHPDKDTHPGKYDITCAGHLLAGESVEDGVRELKEELGLDVPFDHLLPIGVFPVELTYRELIDREFYHTFLHVCDLPLEQYRLQPDEVVGLVRIDVGEAYRLFAGLTDSVAATGLETAADGRPVPVDRLLGRHDFVPHGTDYYKQVLDTIARHLA